MVDSINGPGKRIIITTKPKSKESTENKDGSFDKALKDKSGATDKAAGNQPVLNPAQNNLKIMQQQELVRMQRLQEITRQVQDGTYKMVDPTILAEKIYQVISDSKTREKFIKKLLQEEAEKIPHKDKHHLSDLELKKLVFMIRETQDEPFEDPELEKMLKELS
ncbi:MAG: flagellar biosynthesis anti-sigma factor FlgM [Candidatus Rifleibacteriota bacterium]